MAAHRKRAGLQCPLRRCADKLYLSWLVYDADEVTLSTLTAGQEYYVCVDSFNENGIMPGKTFKLEG